VRWLLDRLTPRTLSGQLAIIILLAVVLVVSIETLTEPLRDRLFPSDDMDAILDRLTMVAEVLGDATAQEQSWLLARAADFGFDLQIVPEAALNDMAAASTSLSFAQMAIETLFPPDREIMPGAAWLMVDGRRALALPVGPDTMLLATNLPAPLESDDFTGPLTYYILSFATLLLLFSFYAARTIVRPIDRIVHELDRTDGISEERHIREEGTREVIRLSRALNAMRARIRAMVDMRMRMLRGVSHDLRTPLTRLKMRVERVEDEALRTSMLADVDRIDALASQTLAYLRIDARGESEERVDISSLLQTVQAEFADVGHAVTYSGPSGVVAICRPMSLMRAVSNLCDNGVKFGTRVEITLDTRADKIRICVSDDGPGIPPDQRLLVTEPFFKLEESRNAQTDPGFGLGLSIVAEIVKAHDETLSFHDNEPHGLAACICLPSRIGETAMRRS